MSDVSSQLAALQAMAEGQAPAANSGPTASNALGGNFLAGGKVPMVYWGQQSHVNTSGRDQEARDDQGYTTPAMLKGRGITDRTTTVQDAVADWYSWTDQERSAFGQRLYKMGLVANPNDYGQVYNMWTNAVQEASNFYTATNGQKKITPWQAVDIMGSLQPNGGQPVTHTQTSKSFNVPTVEDAHAATKQIFQSLMGRDPDQNELDRYSSMMTAYAQKHPTVTKQTQVTDVHGNSTSSSTSSGGYSQAGISDMLGQQAKADPEYGAYQAATTYYNSLVQALGGLGSGG